MSCNTHLSGSYNANNINCSQIKLNKPSDTTFHGYTIKCSTEYVDCTISHIIWSRNTKKTDLSAEFCHQGIQNLRILK
jgi:hypothetical protein